MLPKWPVPKKHRRTLAISLDCAATLQGVSSFESVVYVEDGVWDLKAAASPGYGFIGIWSGEHAERLRLESTMVLADFSNPGLFCKSFSA